MSFKQFRTPLMNRMFGKRYTFEQEIQDASLIRSVIPDTCIYSLPVYLYIDWDTAYVLSIEINPIVDKSRVPGLFCEKDM